MRSLSCFENISFIKSWGINFPKDLHIKPTTYINVLRGTGVEEIGLKDKMRWEFISKMQGGLNLWTWFTSFSSHSLFKNFWDLFEFWEHVNTCGISLINNLPSVGIKASTLWNFNELNFWENYVFSCMIKCKV
jgi:hypothetical protein